MSDADSKKSSTSYLCFKNSSTAACQDSLRLDLRTLPTMGTARWCRRFQINIPARKPFSLPVCNRSARSGSTIRPFLSCSLDASSMFLFQPGMADVRTSQPCLVKTAPWIEWTS